MNYVSLKSLSNTGRKLILSTILLSSCFALSNIVVDAKETKSVDDEIVTVNINESAEVVVSNMVDIEYTIEENEILNGVDLLDVSFNISGFSISEMVVKPKPVVLDSNAVPDGVGVCNSANKTYMAYTAVTSVSSPQYKLLRGSSAYTDTKTGLRMVDGRICIAVGTFYASKIGTKINLVMANGNVVECILGDVKSDRHTDPTHRYQAQDGSVVEMIVDYNYFHSTSQYPSELKGRISRIEIVE